MPQAKSLAIRREIADVEADTKRVAELSSAMVFALYTLILAALTSRAADRVDRQRGTAGAHFHSNVPSARLRGR